MLFLYSRVSSRFTLHILASHTKIHESLCYVVKIYLHQCQPVLFVVILTIVQMNKTFF